MAVRKEVKKDGAERLREIDREIRKTMSQFRRFITLAKVRQMKKDL